MLPRDTIARRAADWCHARGKPLGKLERIEVLPAPAGAVGQVSLFGSEGDTLLSAHEFRQQVAGVELLPSADFEIETASDGWRVRGRGFGHRVGMCQWGARQQAELGRSCQEILAHYYPGTELAIVR
jgi:stage II sporulation protein D